MNGNALDTARHARIRYGYAIMRSLMSASETFPAAPLPSRRILRALGIAIACGAAYFLTLEAFLAVPLFNGATQVRPASGLAPVLGLLLGLPGALGCAAGNLVSDVIHWPDDPALPLYFLVQVAYSYGLRALWRLVFRDGETPRLSSASRITVFLIGAFLDAALVTLLLMPFESDSMQALDIHAVRLLNNFLALVYVGTPVMLIADRFRRHNGERSLSERFALIALAVSALASILCVSAILAFRSAEGEMDGSLRFDGLIAQIYLMLTAITIMLFSLACIMLAVLERMLAMPLHELATDARTLPERMVATGPEQMRDGELDVRLSPAHVLEEIALVANESNAMRHTLGKSMLDAQAVTREQERVATELELASTIQANALPTAFTNLERCYAAGIEAIMRPARTVGGDFYDVFPLDEHRLCVLVADVSDKGVPAALFMMRAMAEARECLRSAGSLGEGLSHATTHLCANNDAMLFVTMFVMALDARTGVIEYANAGHNLPILCSSLRGNQWLKAKPGLPLAVLDDFYYPTKRAQLLPGEQVFMYTDGVTEARSAAGELFGDARLTEALADMKGTCSPVRCVEDAVAAFTAGAEQADDLTALSLSWLPAGSWTHFEAKASLCPEVCAVVRSQLTEAATDTIAFDLDLMVEELYVNVANHAYKGMDENDGIDIYAVDDAFNHVVHLVLQDRGIPYDPTKREVNPFDGTENVDDLQPGGLGILLVRKLSDSLRYERLDDRNILHVTKSYGL